MNLTFYMDEHVPQAITDGLRLGDVDVLTVQEDGAAGRPDSFVFDRSIEYERIIFTQDTDFLWRRTGVSEQAMNSPASSFSTR